MRRNIEAMLNELTAETNEAYSVVIKRKSDGDFIAAIIANANPEAPLFDRRGDRQLKVTDLTVEMAMYALDSLCAIR